MQRESLPKMLADQAECGCMQIKRLFPYALLIGRRFPIVKFTAEGLEVEISSFMSGTKDRLPKDSAFLLGRVSVSPAVNWNFSSIRVASSAWQA